MVVRNGSLFNPAIPSQRAVELAFQFMAGRVVYLKGRDISANFDANGTYTLNTSNCSSSNTTCQLEDDFELGRFRKMWIDNFVPNRLSLIGLHEKTSRFDTFKNYTVVSINYANAQANFNASTAP